MGEVFLTSPPPGYTPPYPQIEAPTGRWKDGLFDVFSYGLCHPQAWLSLCCTESKFVHSFCFTSVLKKINRYWLNIFVYSFRQKSKQYS